MQQLVAHVERVIEREIFVVQENLSRNDIEVIRGRASFVDQHTVTGRILRRPAQVVSGQGAHRRGHAHQQSARSVAGRPDDYDLRPRPRLSQRLPRNIAVVGAGVVGIEYASMFAALGVQVTVIDRRPRPLEFLDHEIVDELIHQMRKADVTFRCGEAVEHIEVVQVPQPKGLIELESGKHIVADVVLFSAGRIGDTDALDLEAVGLQADDRGRLKVDEHHCTGVDNIYAAGDVIGFPALAATSSEQGRLAACHMFGVEAQPMGSHFPVGIYAIPEISMVGATEAELTRERVPYETGIAHYKEISRGQILGDDSGMVKLIFHREDGRLLGAHCIGTGATELVHVGQAVLGLGGGLDYFIRTVFNYPTLAECYKVAAFNAANKLALVRSAVITQETATAVAVDS